MSLDLIDIGSNLTHDSFAQDRDAVMARALQAGVRRQIVTGADLPHSHAAALLAARHPSRLWSTAGVHPHHAQSLTPAHHAELIELLQLDCVVAVGECGLDYFRNLSPPAAQRAAFTAQLEMAAQIAKPVFLHQRDAHGDFTAILKEFDGRLHGGVAHCFTGGQLELETYLALGLHIGITGWACDERRGVELRGVVPRIPSDRLLIETDAPDQLLPDAKNRFPLSGTDGQSLNHPANLAAVYAGLAEFLEEKPESLARRVEENFQRIFGGL